MKNFILQERRKVASRRYRKKYTCLLFLVDVCFEVFEKNQKLKPLVGELAPEMYPDPKKNKPELRHI